jgi:Mor family transcriptional regulator
MPQEGSARVPKISPREERQARAEEIARRFEAGESPSDLAAHFGLSTDRIRDILARHCGYRRGTGGRGAERG